MTSDTQVTELLVSWGKGDETARDKLIPIVYSELRRMAKRHMARQDHGHALQTTALIHEAYIRLVGGTDVQWENRAHFFALASTFMRRVLVDYARAQHSAKRGGEWLIISTNDVALMSDERQGELIALDDALNSLANLNPRHSQIVEFRFFGGLTTKEVAKVIGISEATVERDWKVAKAWLYAQLSS